MTIRAHFGRGFTLVELLIVITIIGIITAMVVTVATRSVDTQKRSVTQQIMSNVTLAIDQFKEANPLRSTYGRRNAVTFGAYPPYELDRPSNDPNSAAELLEPTSVAPGSFKRRLARDVFYDFSAENDTSRISVATDNPANTHDDNRALYTYLRMHAPAALAQVPQIAIKPLSENVAEFVNPGSDSSNENSRLEILGLHDGYGVPLDYFLYAKVERGVRPDGTTGWRVTDRMPMLRSRGVAAEVYAAQRDAVSKDKWVYSSPPPTPESGVDGDTGVPVNNNSTSNGWVRVRGLGEQYKYIPSRDN